MPKLLIVDDDIHLRKLVLTYAKLEGLECEEAENGHKALEKLNSTNFDIIVLDVMMPGMDGFETLEKIRHKRQVPVIMLTARGEEYDKLKGFSLGSDDYVLKPFSPKELMARIMAVLKRAGRNPEDNICFGGLVISPKARTAAIDGKVINLSPKEFDLVLCLAQNEKIVLNRQQLLDKVWGYDYYGDERTVDTHIKSLRERLGSYRDIIHTVWGVGYKFDYEEKENK